MDLVLTAPMGELQLLPLGRVVEGHGTVFSVPDDYGIGLLEQRGNVALPAPAAKVLEGLNLDQLRAICAGRGLEVADKPKKADMVAVLAADCEHESREG